MGRSMPRRSRSRIKWVDRAIIKSPWGTISMMFKKR